MNVIDVLGQANTFLSSLEAEAVTVCTDGAQMLRQIAGWLDSQAANLKQACGPDDIEKAKACLERACKCKEECCGPKAPKKALGPGIVIALELLVTFLQKFLANQPNG